MPLDTSSLRQQFPITEEWNYVNHATHGPFPIATSTAISALAKAWYSPPDLDHSGNDKTTDSVRRMIAKMVNGKPENVAFTGSLAESMSLAASGMDWQAGDNCVIPEHEFPSVVYPFLNLERRGVSVRFAPKGADGFTSLDAIRATADDRTRAIVVSHVEFMNGFRNDLAALSQMAHEMGALLVVDATQSLGPSVVDVASTGVDVIAAHSYKWLMASYGVGVTYLSDRAIERIHPTYAGRLSVNLGFEDLGYELKLRDGAARYQTGGLNWITLSGLCASLELITTMEPSDIAAHTVGLTERLMDGVESKGYTVTSSRETEHRSAIVAFTTGSSEEDAALVSDLEQKKISVALRGLGVRVSPYFYNTDDEIDQLVEALPSR
ncbi:MAG: aminotransferase class V-fold PLP-dependent enzyme [Thermomicrobiaceae bacterium]